MLVDLSSYTRFDFQKINGCSIGGVYCCGGKGKVRGQREVKGDCGQGRWRQSGTSWEADTKMTDRLLPAPSAPEIANMANVHLYAQLA